jgi:aspartate-semialdehyde dehydrogenase
VKCASATRSVKCEDLEQFDFSKVDFVLMSAGGTISKEWSPKAGKTGALVIDNSSPGATTRTCRSSCRR